MRLSLVRWLRPALQVCMMCGRQILSMAHVGHVKHPEPAAVLKQHLCENCCTAIPWIAKPVCMICGRPEACPDCLRRAGRSVIFSRCAIRYDDRMKYLLALYKYRGSEKLERLMASMLAFSFERICSDLTGGNGQPHFHLVTSVPLAKQRLMERGFNQAERMAAIMAEWYGLPYRQTLIRNRHTGKQSLKTRQKRLADLKGTFSASLDLGSMHFLSASSRGPVRILLADDIYTTGSTLNECASTLRNALCAAYHLPKERVEIYGLVWARS